MSQMTANLLALFAFLALRGQVVAQNTTGVAQCTPGLADWSFNSLGQSPCEIGTDLLNVCVSGAPPIPPLPAGAFSYVGPNIGQDTPCTCSSVYYSLVSACAVCQGHTFISWSKYKTNCTAVYPQIFIGGIPSDTRVPNYAYQNVTLSDTFNVTLASTAGGPESTSIPSPTSATNSVGAPSTSPTTTDTGSHSHNHAGVIAGATVGGIVGLVLIAALLFILRRRMHPRSTGRYEVPLPQDELTGHQIGTQQMKLYDPNDPTTFPPSLGNNVSGNVTPAPSYQIQNPVSTFAGRPEVG